MPELASLINCLVQENTESRAMTIITIENADKYDGQEVTIRGWLYNIRESGKLVFPIFRDGTGIIQGVCSLKEKPEAFAALKGLTQESSVIVTGTIRSEQRAPGGFELGITRCGSTTEGFRSDPFPDPVERAWRRFPARPAAFVDSHATAGGDSTDSRGSDSRGTSSTWMRKAIR